MEVKAGICELNGPWTKPEKGNLQRVLYALGFLPESEVKSAATTLYERFEYGNDKIIVRFTAVGRDRTNDRRLAGAPQLSWDEILRWIQSRFIEYQQQKAAHSQWKGVGHRLYKTAVEHALDVDAFVEHWKKEARIRTGI